MFRTSRFGSMSISKAFAVFEVHHDVADIHFRAWTLGAEGNGNAFVRLNVQDEPVRLDVLLPKNHVRSAAELDDDFGRALRQSLPGSQIEGHSGPAPVVDQQARGDECLRF